MLDIDKIRAALQDRVLSRVSEATGLHRNTIRAIRDGKPTANKTTLNILAAYLGVGDE